MDPNCAANQFVSDENTSENKTATPDTKLAMDTANTKVTTDTPAPNIRADAPDTNVKTDTAEPNLESAFVKRDSDGRDIAATTYKGLQNLFDFWTSDYGISIISCATLFILAIKTACDCENIRIPLKHYTPFANK